MATGAGRTLRLDAIVLAAGFGSRFGGRKLTLPWRGGRLIDGALGAALAAPVREVVVVTGADAEVAEAVAAYRVGRDHERLRTLYAPDHSLGMASSLTAGVAALSADCDGVFVFLGDMPLVPPNVPLALAEALAAGAMAAAPSFDGRRGHPVLFGRALFPALAVLTGDEGAREVLRGLGVGLAIIPSSDPGVLIDVDAPGDLSALE
jgi:molybdenum cofactor cytidylyltransferase